MAKTEVRLSLSPQYLVFVFAILGIVFLFAGFLALNAKASHRSLITISASGTVTANPAQSTIYLFLNGTGNSSASASANLSAITGKLLAALQPFINGNSSMIQTLSYDVYATSTCSNFTYYPPIYPTTTIYCPSPRRFYIASEDLQVTVPNIGDTDAALSAISTIVGINVGSVSAKLSPQQQANMSQQALTLALSNATIQAKALATGGTQLTIENITVQNNYVFYANAGVLSSKLFVNQTFFPGRATVTKNIYVVFSMH